MIIYGISQLIILALVAAILVTNQIGNFHIWFRSTWVQFIFTYITLLIIDGLILFLCELIGSFIQTIL